MDPRVRNCCDHSYSHTVAVVVEINDKEYQVRSVLLVVNVYSVQASRPRPCFLYIVDSIMEGAPYPHSLAGKDFEQWNDMMNWSGQADSIGAHSASSASTVINYDTSPDNPYRHISYPTSPSTANSGRAAGFPSRPINDEYTSNLLTPSNSSGSPEIPPLPELRSCGDTFRDSSPVPTARPLLKRKFSPSEAISIVPRSEEFKPASKKRPHNVIEKRYRANLNEKIAELRDSVPSLRISKRATTEQDVAGYNEDEDLDGLSPTNKLNKASVLTKAVEYIRHLELRNKKLDDENMALKERLHTLDKVLASGGNSSAERAAAFTSNNAVEQTLSPPSSNDPDDTAQLSRHPPQGLIPVPESWRKLRAGQSQEHYGHIYEGQRSGRKWPTKLMLGSIAGLMIMEGFSESDQGSESKEKGLFGIPLEFLDGYWFLRSPGPYLAAFGQYCRAGGLLPLIKGFTALTILAFFVFAYLFNSKPVPKQEELVKPQQAPSLASPIEVRRQAWLTSMQMLKLPHHSFFPEWLAVTNEWLRYCVRLIFGPASYSWMTGRSSEDELARVKAWDIAMDAQLAGGDPEISRSRLLLTIFGAGTLPRTPARLMLKALHCRVLLRNTGEWYCLATRLADYLALYVANLQWALAQQANGLLSPNHPDAIPTHLAKLLVRDCHDVMSDSVIRRAFNLLYGRPTAEAADVNDTLMDVVVEDHAVRSPLDAVAAWWSSQELRKALICSLESGPISRKSFQKHLQSAIEAAPPASAAHTRALAVNAAFFEHRRTEYTQHVLATLPATKEAQRIWRDAAQIPRFIDSSTPASAAVEISTILHCVKVMELLDGDKYVRTCCNVEEDAINLFLLTPLDPLHMSLLSFAPAYHVLRNILGDGEKFASSTACEQVLRKLSAWAHIEGADSAALPEGVVAKLDELCAGIKELKPERRQSNVSNDTGYGSMCEAEAI